MELENHVRPQSYKSSDMINHHRRSRQRVASKTSCGKPLLTSKVGVSNPMIMRSNFNSMGHTIAKKIVNNIQNKPIVVKGSLRNRSMVSRGQQRFKFLGFRDKHAPPKDEGFTVPDFLLFSPREN